MTAFFDTNVLVYMLNVRSAGCDTLYAEDLQHGRRIGPLSIVNPFL